MMIDGEWRVAFLAADHPGLAYGTAPMPVDGNKSLYGSGYINGTIIGIPKGGKNHDRGLGARQVPDDEHARARDRSPTGSATSPRPRRRRGRRSSSPTRTSRRSRRSSSTRSRRRFPSRRSARRTSRRFTSFLAKWQAGKVKDLRGRRSPRSTSRSTPSSSRSGGGGPACMNDDGRDRGGARRGRGRPPTSQARREPAATPHGGRLPLAPGSSASAVFFGYPLVMSAWLSPPQLRPAHPAALGRACELPLHVRRGSRRSGPPCPTRCG